MVASAESFAQGLAHNRCQEGNRLAYGGHRVVVVSSPHTPCW